MDADTTPDTTEGPDTDTDTGTDTDTDDGVDAEIGRASCRERVLYTV